MSATTGRVAATLSVAAILALIWGALAFGAVYPWAYTPLAIVCAATGLAALTVRRRGRPPIADLARGLMAIGFAIALQLVPLPGSLVDRVNPNADAFSGPLNTLSSSFRALSLAPSRTALGLALYVSFALFFLGVTRLLSAVGASAVTRPLIVFGVVLALIGIVQYVLAGGDTFLMKIYGFWRPQNRASPFGPFVNRNHFAGWMIMVLPLALGGARSAWEAGRDLAAGSFADRVSWASTASAGGMLLMLFSVAVMGLSLMISQSRSGMTGFAVGALMFAWAVVRSEPTARSKAVAAALFAVILVGVGLWAGADRIVQRASSVRGDASTVGGRRQIWADTLHLVRDFPVAGAGLNTFGTAMMLYQTDRDVHFEEAHNDYLQLAAEGGLLVGVPVLLTAVIFVRDIRRRFREAPKRGTTYWLRVGAVIGLLSIGLQSLVEFSLQMPGNAALFAMLAAIAVHQSPNLRPAPSRAGGGASA